MVMQIINSQIHFNYKSNSKTRSVFNGINQPFRFEWQPYKEYGIFQNRGYFDNYGRKRLGSYKETVSL